MSRRSSSRRTQPPPPTPSPSLAPSRTRAAPSSPPSPLTGGRAAARGGRLWQPARLRQATACGAPDGNRIAQARQLSSLAGAAGRRLAACRGHRLFGSEVAGAHPASPLYPCPPSRIHPPTPSPAPSPAPGPPPGPAPSRALRRRCPSPSTRAPAARAAAARAAASVQVASRLQPRLRATRRALERTARALRHPSGLGVARVPACVTPAAAAGAAPMAAAAAVAAAAAAAAAARPWRRRATGSSRARRARRGATAPGRPRRRNGPPPLWASGSWAGR
jgi:hypothetical protein